MAHRKITYIIDAFNKYFWGQSNFEAIDVDLFNEPFNLFFWQVQNFEYLI